MSRRRSRRRRNPARTVILVLVLILIAASAILASRFAGLNHTAGNGSFSDLFGRITSLLSGQENKTEPTTDSSVSTPEMLPAPTGTPELPTPTPFAEPVVFRNERSFAVEGRAFAGETIALTEGDSLIYVKLSEFAAFLGTEMNGDSSDGTFRMIFQNTEAVFTAEKDTANFGGDTVSLSGPVVLFNGGKDAYIPAEAVLDYLYSAHSAGKDGTVNYSNFTTDFALQPDRDIPIISYYTVTDDQAMAEFLVSSEWVVPSDFEEQLKYIRDNGYTAISFEDLANLPDITKPVMLTFDGCWRDLYTIVFPMIQQYNTKINVFVWPDYLGAAGHLTEAQLREMAESDLVSIQAGIEVYKPTDTVVQETLFAQIDKAKDYVTTLIGHEPIAFAYPVGGITYEAQQYCSSEFRFCVRRSGERPYNTSLDDGSIIYRYTIQRGTPVAMLSYWLSRSN